jgi:hypothetical protein
MLFSGGLCGYVNSRGETVIAPEFDRAATFDGDFLLSGCCLARWLGVFVRWVVRLDGGAARYRPKAAVAQCLKCCTAVFAKLPLAAITLLRQRFYKTEVDLSRNRIVLLNQPDRTTYQKL